MNAKLNLKRVLVLAFLSVLLLSQPFLPAMAYAPGTLYNGCRGEEVRELQQALIDLGFLKGPADGIFGNGTENAVRKFQKKNRLDVDGLAGQKTLELILRQAEAIRNPAPTQTPGPTKTPKPAKTPRPVKTPKPTKTPKPAKTPKPSANLFSGNYSAIRIGDRGDRVRILQNALDSVGCLSGRADGIFGKKTFNAVKVFQRKKKLTVDGVAGKQTLTALEKAAGGTISTPTPSPAEKPVATPAPTPTPKPAADEDLNDPIKAPKVSKLILLHWFNDIKPVLSNGQHLLIYDPSTGLNWTLRVMSRGRHCDAEPLTAKDTRTMVRSFGGVNTWNQKAVYVKLPDGRWTIGSTHDMPHQSGGIKDNDFNGHLCVHFLRDMDEAKKNDPNYGVANQETIRAFWKKWTGKDAPD